MLTHCVSNKGSENELFIIQPGKTALLAKARRDRRTQALLEVDESILKVPGARLDKMLGDEHVQNIIAALGVGIQIRSWGLGDALSLDRLRYDKIIVAMDENQNGCYIRVQVIALFYKFMRSVLEEGHVFTMIVAEKDVRSEESFFQAVLDFDTRKIFPARVGNSLSSTVALNRTEQHK